MAQQKRDIIHALPDSFIPLSSHIEKELFSDTASRRVYKEKDGGS